MTYANVCILNLYRADYESFTRQYRDKHETITPKSKPKIFFFMISLCFIIARLLRVQSYGKFLTYANKKEKYAGIGKFRLI